MSDSEPAQQPRSANLLGALTLALADQVAEAAERASGLTDAGPAALVSLQESASGRSIEELRTLVGLTHSGAVRLVDRLVAAGYVERGKGSTGRSVGLGLTARGTAVAERIRSARQEVLVAALAHLDEGDVAVLARLCDLMLAGVSAQRLQRRIAGGEPGGGALCRLCDFVACGRPVGQCPAARGAAEAAG